MKQEVITGANSFVTVYVIKQPKQQDDDAIKMSIRLLQELLDIDKVCACDIVILHSANFCPNCGRKQ